MSYMYYKKPLLEVKKVKSYFKFSGVEPSKFLDQKIIELLLMKPSLEPNPIEKEVRDDYWTFGREKRIIDGNDYMYIQNEILGKAVDGASFTLRENDSICIIGESGCGKTSLLYSIMNFPLDYICFKDGEINYYLSEEETPINFLTLTESEMRQYRGIHISLIPQLPKESLNPWLQIGFQSGEILLERLSMRQEMIKEKVLEFLGKVAIPDPNISLKKYVHQLSGGEAQRVCIAMSLLADPRIVLGDEPLYSLDTMSQAAVIDMFLELRKELNFSYIFATHNIGSAGLLGDMIAVMYGGEIIEIRPAKDFFEEPLHPYSKGLLNASPWYAFQKRAFLEEILGELPQPNNWPSGCKFHPRCPYAEAKCKTYNPTRIQIEESFVECHLYS